MPNHALADGLFPAALSPRILTGFTTAPPVRAPSPIAIVPLSDHDLGVHKLSSRTRHPLAAPPAPSAPPPDPDSSPAIAWEAAFPRGSLNPANASAPPGGFGFYLRGPPAFAAQLARAEEVLMGYAVMFEDGWAWGRGGKLPGIYGGAGEAAYGCAGGRQSHRDACFDLRLMWRADGAGELYAYLPQLPSNTARLAAVPPLSVAHADYGFSVGRGAWRFSAGRWHAVAQRVRLNAPGRADGEVEVFIDGASVLCATGLVLRADAAPRARVHGLHFQTFFGGHTPEWAAPQDQRAWFAHVSGALLRPASPGHDEL
ncbi:hypothetical protein AcV5_003865 [Taiwanofungus camphoratus]|nr:hypothetical protein AcV5_003865 [Antrodia cinnamomea]